MQNSRLKNKIVPWRNKGRWYTMVIYSKATTSGGSTYNWYLDEEKSDNIFSSTNKPNTFTITNNTTNNISIISRFTGKRPSIIEGKCELYPNSTRASAYNLYTNILTLPQLLVAGTSQNITHSNTASVTTVSDDIRIKIHLFINL